MENSGNSTVYVLRDGKELKRFENQQNDFEGFRYLLNNQSQSTDWAIRYEGWEVIVQDTPTGELYSYREEKQLLSVVRIASKLINNGVTRENFDPAKCLEILSACSAPAACTNVFELYLEFIPQILP